MLTICCYKLGLFVSNKYFIYLGMLFFNQLIYNVM